MVGEANANRQTSGESASLPQYLGCNTVFDMRLRVTFSSPEDRITSIKHCATRISSKMATIDECIEFAFKILVFDEGTESADIATNENILLLGEYSKVKLF